MKILHTSDWHIGHRLHEQSQFYEQEKFLNWLIQLINKQSIDILLVSGDIFDNAYPSSQSLDLFYRFLADLYKNTKCKQVIMTAGNHDSPGTLNAPDNFVRSFNIHLIGRASDDIKNEIYSFNIGDENIIIAAVPFLRDRDIRKAISGESGDDIEHRYKKALKNHYHALAQEIEKLDNKNAFVLAMGHLFAIGGQPTDSENRIYVGGLGDISASDFPDLFDYIALGHLHRPQIIDNERNIRYSGSPYILSFSEAEQKKSVLLISTTNSKITSVEEIEIPAFRELFIVKGSMEYCKTRLNEIAKSNTETEPWVEIVLDEKNLETTAYTAINEEIENLKIKVLKVRMLNNAHVKGIEQLEEEDRELNDLKPFDVFKKKCEGAGFILSDHHQIKDAFYEILNEIDVK